MKIKAVALALAVAGFGASVAIAKGPPPGKGTDATASTAAAPTSASTGRNVQVCHRTHAARRPFRMISVSSAALETHMRHGDLITPSAGACPTSERGGSPTTTTSAAP
jgi:hypothetical protein